TRIGSAAMGMRGPFAARMAGGLTGGAVIGAGDAATRGENPMTGAGTGAAVGFASPIVGRVVGGAVREASKFAAPLGPELTDYARGAINKVSRALTDDDIALARSRAANLGPQGMLVDLGPNLRLQGEALATQPGSANRIVSDAAGGRFADASSRIREG